MAARDGLADAVFLSTLSLRRATAAIGKPTLEIAYFYPRSPCGERPIFSQSAFTKCIFLSTLSLRRATYGRINDISRLIFLSTLSLRRATIDFPLSNTLRGDFYPRSPCGERHHYGWSWYDDFTISIHALLAESDPRSSRAVSMMALFLSTLSLRRATTVAGSCRKGVIDFYPRSPCGERPCRAQALSVTGSISIHALLAESDRTGYHGRADHPHFYPRSPCGERHIPLTVSHLCQ